MVSAKNTVGCSAPPAKQGMTDNEAAILASGMSAIDLPANTRKNTDRTYSSDDMKTMLYVRWSTPCAARLGLSYSRHRTALTGQMAVWASPVHSGTHKLMVNSR